MIAATSHTLEVSYYINNYYILHFNELFKKFSGHLQNLRESTSNDKVRNYHKEFYRPENLIVIIAGQVKHGDVFKVLQPLEEKILAKVLFYIIF